MTTATRSVRFAAPPTQVSYNEVDTPLGGFLVAGHGDVLVGVRLPGTWRRDDVPTAWRRDQGALSEPAGQLERYFDGTLRRFDLRYAPTGTAFQLAVWRALCAIEYGTTASYRDVARAVGNERATRAVGLANNRNPIALFIPCHRVIGADGSLTGYGGGLEMKTWLLAHERAVATTR